VFRWPVTQRVGGLGIFACQHHTRDAVWVPSLQTHANGATRILRVLVASDDPAGSAAALASAIDVAATQDGDFHVVTTAPTRGAVAFAQCDAVALPREGGAAMVLGSATPRPPGFATGVAVIFQPA
jgi:hypothetical protein